MGKFIEKFEENMLSLLLVAMTMLVFMEVIARFLNTSTLWADELTQLCSAWMVMFGASYCVKKGAHIGVDVVTASLSDKNKRIVAIIAGGLCVLYCWLIAWGGYIYLAKVYKYHIVLDDLPLEKWEAHTFIVVSTLLMSTRFMFIIRDNITGKMIGMALTDEAEQALDAQEIADKAYSDLKEDK